MIHIGNRIREVLDESGMTVTAFAKLIPCTRENAHRLFKKDNIDIVLLKRISLILGHDFFLDLSECDFVGHSDENGYM